ncbi:ATP-dependent RNA helicase dbp6 [Podila horticola]|nr:ATP-dependent RNA helicase dbp6 [Podila horticola]
MFIIKRFDIDAQSAAPSISSSTQPPLANNDRLAKLNARLNKNKQPTTSSSNATATATADKPSSSLSIPSDNSRDRNHSKKERKDPNEISYKRSREHEEARAQKYEKKWGKRAKQLKDEDLIPNDVRLAMKAEAEAAALAKRHGSSANAIPMGVRGGTAAMEAQQDQEMKSGPEPQEKQASKQEEEGKEDTETMDTEEAANQDQDEADKDEIPTEIDGVKQHVDEAEVDAALADLALVPLPTFEVKEITATERERAKSMGIPDWLAHPTKIEPEINTPIDSPMFGFSQRLIKQCQKAGIEECFAVQTAVIPVLMRARHLGDIRKAPGDLCVSAPTGSGKTLAYVLPIIEILSQRVVTRLRALVVLPTRDLCVQVKETFDTFVKGTDLKIATSTGQNSFAHEQGVLAGDNHSTVTGTPEDSWGGHSRVDVLITTPGRLIDHIKSTPNFTLQHLRFLVIDEADRLLNQSFQDWLYHILTAIHPSTDPAKMIRSPGEVDVKKDQYGFPIHDAIAPGFLSSFFQMPESDVEDPKALSVQKLLFSATLTRNPAKIASLQLSDPQYVAVQDGGNEDGEDKQKYTTPAGLTEHMIVCDTSEKPLMVLHLLHHRKVRSALCFTKSVESAHRLYKLIQLYERQRTSPTPATTKDNAAESVKIEEIGAKEAKKESEEGSSDSDNDSDSDSSDSDSSDSSTEDDEEEEKDDVEMENVEASKKDKTLEPASTEDIPMEEEAQVEQEPLSPIVVAEYSSDLSKAKRQQILRQFNAGEIHLLICSDLISRGMDLSPVSVVINYDVPVYMKKYIHRVGRTARAGKTGTAYSLVEMQEARHFKEMIAKAGHWDKISRIKVKDQDIKDLVPGYKHALSGLRDALSLSASQHRKPKFRRSKAAST